MREIRIPPDRGSLSCDGKTGQGCEDLSAWGVGGVAEETLPQHENLHPGVNANKTRTPGKPIAMARHIDI
jgi:hypothetical protein